MRIRSNPPHMMSRNPISQTALLEQLEVLASCKLAGECLHIKATLPHTVKSLEIERPTFGLVLHGSKRIASASQAVQLQAGDVFLITGRCMVDAFNAPDASNGRFLVMTLNLCDEGAHSVGAAAETRQRAAHWPARRSHG